jgi:adenylylsulfate kinase
VCIAVRGTTGIDERNPFPYEYVRPCIEHGLREYGGLFTVVSLPNITRMFYGRDVGYLVERIELDPEVEAISATSVRARLSLGGS